MGLMARARKHDFMIPSPVRGGNIETIPVSSIVRPWLFPMKRSRVAVDYPLWDRLRKLDKVAARRFPTDYDRGFGSLGLILHPRPLRYGYFSTPKNA